MDPIIGGALTIVVSYFSSRRLAADVGIREREKKNDEISQVSRIGFALNS